MTDARNLTVLRGGTAGPGVASDFLNGMVDNRPEGTELRTVWIASGANQSTWRVREAGSDSEDIIDTSMIVKRFGDERGSRLLVYLNSAASARFAREALEAGHPIGVGVWDHSTFLSRAMSRRDSEALAADFDAAIANAKAVVCVSDTMADFYSSCYDLTAPPIVLRYSPPQHVWDFGSSRLAAGQYCHPPGALLAGSLYATREWRAFLAAARNMEVNGERLRVGFNGWHSRRVRRRSWVNYGPALPLDELRERSSHFSFGYVPYWRTGRGRLHANLAFPSKASLYVALGMPILLHGPQESDCAQFLNRFGLGETVDSTDAKLIGESITAIHSPQFADEYVRARAECYEAELSGAAVARRLEQLSRALNSASLP